MSVTRRRHQEDVTKFFDGYATHSRDIYRRRNAPTMGGFIDRLTRKSMFVRFEEAMRQCQAANATCLLDVGCGSGSHDVILAEILGIRIRGIDIAPKMIEIAKSNAQTQGLSKLCEYSTMDFLKFEGGCNYDIALALGVIEYIEEPAEFVKKMLGHARKRVILNLPVKWHILTPQRVVRYKLRKCPVNFITNAVSPR